MEQRLPAGMRAWVAGDSDVVDYVALLTAPLQLG